MKSHLATRFDRSLAKHSYDFYAFGNQEGIIRSIAMYIAFSYQNTVFRYCTLDPYHFAQTMGWNVDELNRKVENPVQVARGEYIEGGPLYDTYLENAMYRMMVEPLVFSMKGNFKEEFKTEGVKSVLLLEEFYRHTHKINPKKNFYHYKPSQLFIDNLSNYFVSVDLKVYRTLKTRHRKYKPGLQALYCFLTYTKEVLKKTGQVEATPAFNMLCKIAVCNDKEPRFAKNNLITKIMEVEEVAKMGLVLEWISKPQTKHKYQPIITFKNNLVPDSEKDIRDLHKDRFNVRFFQALFELYKNDYLKTLSESEALPMDEWYRDLSLNIRGKAMAYVEAQRIAYNNKISIDSKEVTKFFSSNEFNPIPYLEMKEEEYNLYLMSNM